MANKVAVVTDSIACLDSNKAIQNGISVVPAVFSSQGKVYRDWVDLTPTEAYEIFLKDPDSFNTSPPSVSDYLSVFQKLAQEGKDIFCVTITSRLSAMYDVARTAAGQVMEEFPSVSIEVFDSETTTAAEGFVALEAARSAGQNKTLDEVAHAARGIKNKVNFFILLDTIRHVYRSGRIPKIASTIGSKINVKPILTMSSGVMKFAGVARNKERGLERLLELFENKVAENPVHVAVMHAYAPDDARRLEGMISTRFNCVELWTTEFSPVMGYVCGTGTVGFAFYRD